MVHGKQPQEQRRRRIVCCVAAAALALLLALVGVLHLIGPWAESTSSGPIEVSLVHPGLLARLTDARREPPLSERLEVIDSITGERITAAEFPLHDTAEDSVSGLNVLWHPDRSRIVCVFHYVGYGSEPGSACFEIERNPLRVRRIDRGEWIMEAIPPEAEG